MPGMDRKGGLEKPAERGSMLRAEGPAQQQAALSRRRERHKDSVITEDERR